MEPPRRAKSFRCITEELHITAAAQNIPPLFFFIPLPCLGLWGSLTCITYSSYKPFKSSTLTLLVSSSFFFFFFFFYSPYIFVTIGISHIWPLSGQKGSWAHYTADIYSRNNNNNHQMKLRVISTDADGCLYIVWWAGPFVSFVWSRQTFFRTSLLFSDRSGAT